MNSKNKYGQYFTNVSIARFMVSQISHDKNAKVLEPCSGKGVFIDALFEQNFNNITAYEIDSSLEQIYDFVQNKSFISIPTSEKFDVIIGNPPYIRWKNLEPELKAELEDNQLWNTYFNSLCDYLFIFILKSIEHLTDNGELIFICPEYWLKTTHSQTLRDYMCENGYFAEIYSFKEKSLFEKVNGSFIVFKYIKAKTETKKLNLINKTSNNNLCKLFNAYNQFEEPLEINDDDFFYYQLNDNKLKLTSDILKSKLCFDKVKISQFKVGERWIFAQPSEKKELDEFEEGCRDKTTNSEKLHLLADICFIANGMVSGFDDAFKYDDLSKLTLHEKKALINVVKSKYMQPFKVLKRVQYIFIEPNISEEVFSKNYPNFKKHFAPFIAQLNNRYDYKRDIPYWSFSLPRSKKHFDTNETRIFVPCKERISNKNYFRFVYAQNSDYATQDVTAIFKKSETKESIEYILAFLNTKRVFQWLLFNGIVKGAIVEFSEAPIASIPFRKIDWDNEQEVEIHQKITLAVSEFLNSQSSKNEEQSQNDDVLHNLKEELERYFDILFKLDK